MDTLLLLGNEAIAQGAIDGGLSGCYAYPGTPSTELMEYIQNSKEAEQKGIHHVWSTNEKTAMEAAMGMSYAGKRALVAFKHVGLNVAADAFMNASITGVNGGVVVLVADDPSMHSSQNEQDSRTYVKFALLPLLEPSNQQEAYDMMYGAFEFSEMFKVPLLMRITTRLAHSRAPIVRKPIKSQNNLKFPDDPNKFILLPAISRANYQELIDKDGPLVKYSESSPFNAYIEGSDKKLGIIASGIGFNYVMECYPEFKSPHPIVKITQYPTPRKLIERLYDECDEILVVEEGYPIIEEMMIGYIKNITKPIHGRLDGWLPRAGELSPLALFKALGAPVAEEVKIPSIVKARPPQLCQGCSHRDVAEMINAAVADYGKGRVFGDIGCYTLTKMPPFNTISTCLDMGASITMAKGAADAGLVPSVALIGDSTFTHSGITGLLDAVIENSPITVVISDNYTTGMTGGQDSAATNRIVNICKGLGVNSDHIRLINPLKKFAEENLAIMKEEMAYNGLSVIVAQRECIQTFQRRAKANRKEKVAE